MSDLYADLPLRIRREQVRPHKSMLHVLQKVKDELGISLNATGVFYAVGQTPEEATAAQQRTLQQERPQQSSMPTECGGAAASLAEEGDEVGETPQQQQQQQQNTAAAAAVTLPPEVVKELTEPALPPIDFYFDVELADFPLPPADFDVPHSKLQRQVSHSSSDGAVIAMRDFVAFIPPFFAPLSAVLARMPGYTEEHIQRYFKASTMEVVKVSGERYIRMHGGYEKLSLAGCEAAAETFREYRPLPSLAPHFVNAFAGVTDRWMPLQELLRRVDPAVVAQLPFQGAAAVMYFAQMQHIFAFAVRQLPPQQDGAAATTEAAVLLRRPDYCGLDCETTPTPKVMSLLFTLVPSEGQVEIRDVARQLTNDAKAELEAYYGGLPQFFAKHAPIFYVPPETPTVVMRLRYRERLHVTTLSLEEQLEHAMKRGNKAKVRIIRRRIAFRDNPSHPLHDPENLAKELSRHLPRRGFVIVKQFLKHSIPDELLNFMPPKMHNFFKGYPQYFTQFEYQKPGTWCLCKPDQPLPRGVIRQSFSEADLVRIIAEYLQKKGPRPLSTVLLNIPRGAQDTVRKRYGGMYFFVTRYPQYFNVVLGSDNNNAQASGLVHLIQVPSTELADAAMAASAIATNNPHAPSIALPKEKDDDDDDSFD